MAASYTPPLHLHISLPPLPPPGPCGGGLRHRAAAVRVPPHAGGRGDVLAAVGGADGEARDGGGGERGKDRAGRQGVRGKREAGHSFPHVLLALCSSLPCAHTALSPILLAYSLPESLLPERPRRAPCLPPTSSRLNQTCMEPPTTPPPPPPTTHTHTPSLGAVPAGV